MWRSLNSSIHPTVNQRLSFISINFLPTNFLATNVLPIVKKIFIIALLVCVSACQQKVESHKTSIFSFGTVIDVEVTDVNQQQAEKIFAAIEDDLKRMHIFWHPWKKGPLARTNLLCETTSIFSAATSVIPLILKARSLAIQSDHLFNPAIGRLVKLWGFQQDEFDMNIPPEDAAIQALVKANPKMTDISISGVRFTCLNAAVKVDLGGIAKGYALEQILNNLRANYAVKNIVINAGGDLKAFGQHGNRPWRVGIRDPLSSNSETAIATINANSGDSIFTSGNYERYYLANNKRIHHIIDPRTGYPAKGSLSVTVIHADASVADAAATALFVAGPTQWAELAKKMKIKNVMLIDDKNNIHITQSMLERVDFIKEPKSLFVVRP